MCGTCGCGEDNIVKYSIPGKENINHDTEHKHDHGHMSDHHHHDGNEHVHSHNHTHEIQLEIDILSSNNKLAERNRGYFDALNITVLNLVSSPGSGKTSILERTIKEIGNEIDFYIIEGDQQTTNDADRIASAGAPVIQVNTGNGCHLDAEMINTAAKQLKPNNDSMLMIENVGNLVCPSMFDLGESNRVVIISTTEGEDKPIKYPPMFESSQLCLINKTDLLPYLDFDIEKLKEYAMRINPQLELIEVSAKTGEGMSLWYDWLKKKNKK